MPIRFQWYHKSKPISDEIPIELHHGDVYAFSHTAVGGDWMCPSKTTLRHGVGRKAVTRAIAPAPADAGSSSAAGREGREECEDCDDEM